MLALFVLYMAYGAFYLYYLHVNNLTDREAGYGEDLSIIVVANFFIILFWPVLPFVCARGYVESRKQVVKLKARLNATYGKTDG